MKLETRNSENFTALGITVHAGANSVVSVLLAAEASFNAPLRSQLKQSAHMYCSVRFPGVGLVVEALAARKLSVLRELLLWGRRRYKNGRDPVWHNGVLMLHEVTPSPPSWDPLPLHGTLPLPAFRQVEQIIIDIWANEHIDLPDGETMQLFCLLILNLRESPAGRQEGHRTPPSAPRDPPSLPPHSRFATSSSSRAPPSTAPSASG